MHEPIVFNCDTGQFTLEGINGAVKISTKFSDFLCILMQGDPDQYVDRHMLARLDSWSGNLPLSVGKQVGRFLTGLAKHGLFPVDCRQRTNGWRLSSAWRATLPSHVKDAVASHIESRMTSIHLGSPDDFQILLSWYRDNFDALVAMTTGRAREGYSRLRASMRATDDESLLAVTNLLATRIEQRLGEARLPIMASVRPYGDAFMRAVEIRRSAAYALHARSQDWPSLEKMFKRQLAQLSNTGDFTTIAILRNALGVLYKRMGRLSLAKDQLAQAAPLAIFSGDLILIQNIAFNLANISSEIVRENPQFVNKSAIWDLLDFDAQIRNSMALGKDSAQTELLLAYLYFEEGEFEGAQKYLTMANAIIGDSGNPIDRALSARIEGLLLANAKNAPWEMVELAKSKLQIAREIYRKEGYVAAAEHIAMELQTIEMQR